MVPEVLSTPNMLCSVGRADLTGKLSSCQGVVVDKVGKGKREACYVWWNSCLLESAYSMLDMVPGALHTFSADEHKVLLHQGLFPFSGEAPRRWSHFPRKTQLANGVLRLERRSDSKVHKILTTSWILSHGSSVMAKEFGLYIVGTLYCWWVLNRRWQERCKGEC